MVEGSYTKKAVECHPGTIIEVAHLFNSVPARRVPKDRLYWKRHTLYSVCGSCLSSSEYTFHSQRKP